MSDHRTTLNSKAMGRIRERIKKMEFRLKNNQWVSLRTGDTIEFVNNTDHRDQLKISVHAVVNYRTFVALLDHFDSLEWTGWCREELLERLRTYYYEEAEKEYSVLGIIIGEILEDTASTHLYPDPTASQPYVGE